MLDRIPWLSVVTGAILLLAGVFVFAVIQAMLHPDRRSQEELPFYSTADAELARKGSDLYRELNCRECHSIWSVKSVMQAVPAPSLDGIGSLRSEEWLYRYFSAKDPQKILPSRLKKKYQHPSYADLPEEKRRLLARYFASMKVRDWYFDEALKAEQEKLTGKREPGAGSAAGGKQAAGHE